MGYFKDLIVRIKGDSSQLKGETKKAEGTLNTFGKNTKSIGAKMGSMFATLGVAIGAAFAVKALVRFGSESVRLYDIQIKALTKVATAVEATGGAAGFTTAELAKTASELQKITTFGDEEILNNVTAQLLTFTGIAGEQFKGAQMAALNLATTLDGDLKSASIQLGKALNDPVTNLSALSRSGIQFSDSQKATIKGLAETNQLAEAQSIILAELNRQYGGQAEAQAKIGLGPWKQIRNQIGDMREELGAKLMPIINKFGVFVQALLPKIQAGFKTVGDAIRRVRGEFIEVYNSSVLLRAMIGLLAASFKTGFAAIKLAVQQIFTPLKMVGQIIGAVLTGKFKEIPGIIKDSFNKSVNNFKDFGVKAVDNYASAIKGARDKFIEPLKPTAEDVRDINTEFKKAGTEAANSFSDGLAARDQTVIAKAESKKSGSVTGGVEAQAGPAGRVKDAEAFNAALKEAAKIYPELELAGVSTWEALAEATAGFEEQLSKIPAGLLAIRDRINSDLTPSQQSFETLERGALAFGDAILAAGQSGEDGLRGLAKAAVQTAKKIISAEIATGIASSVAKALSSVPFPFNLVAGALAGGAAAAAFNAAIPSFAGGGIVTAPTLAMVGDNPGRKEAIIPSEMWGKMGGGGGRLTAEVTRRGLKWTLDEETAFLNRT